MWCLSRSWITRPFLSSSSTGGRYKKEVSVDGQSHLLLIREETGPPDGQVPLCVFVCETGVHKEHNNVRHHKLQSSNIPPPPTFFFPVQQLGWCGDPGLQSGEWSQFPGALPALQPAQRSPLRHPSYRRGHPRLERSWHWRRHKICQ